MDLQTRKINFIQDFLKLESEKAIAQFERLLRKETVNNSEFKPMSISEFHSRIEKSTKDSEKGKVTDVEDLISEIEKWS
jgi:hypothetical protein